MFLLIVIIMHWTETDTETFNEFNISWSSFTVQYVLLLLQILQNSMTLNCCAP